MSRGGTRSLTEKRVQLVAENQRGNEVAKEQETLAP